MSSNIELLLFTCSEANASYEVSPAQRRYVVPVDEPLHLETAVKMSYGSHCVCPIRDSWREMLYFDAEIKRGK